MQSPPRVNRYDFPADWYVAKGVLHLAPDVSEIARDFWKSLSSTFKRDRWIVGFDWAINRTMRWKADGPTFDEGPGIDPSGFRDTEIPLNTVETVDGVPLVYIIPPDVVANAKSKMIVQAKTNSGRASFALE